MNCLHRRPVRLVLACLAFALISVGVSPRQTAGQTASPAATRADPDTVLLTVSVWDKKGSSVDGLEKSHFTVLDDSKPREITFFKGQGDEPASIGIVFDASHSMVTAKTERVRDALSRFMRQGHPETDYFLIGFNDSPQLLADWTRDADRIASAIASIKPKHNTALYDACYLAVEKILRGRHAKRVILLITDGQDNNSRFTYRELTKLLQESDVMIYVMGLLDTGDSGSLGMEGQAILESLSGIGGGVFYFPDTSKALDTFFERLAFELRHQYQLGFRLPDNARDGKWHKIKVKVTLPAGAAPPGLKIAGVRTREGYYATKNPH